MKLLALFSALISFSTFSSVNLINGIPVGDKFKGVGTFDVGCTITKVGPKQFITAAHCVNGREKSISLNFQDFRGRVKVHSAHLHASWLKDCKINRCTGKEVGGPYMTPGRSDVAFYNVVEETPAIPVINVNFNELSMDTEVAMVGAGCTRRVEPQGNGKMRYALTRLISWEALIHEHSLYGKIAEVTGQSNWITPGYQVSHSNASLCPGDSGGPLLAKNNSNEWEIVGIAADYTFDGPYVDGNETITNIHTRLDDQSFNNIGSWIREVWAN